MQHQLEGMNEGKKEWERETEPIFIWYKILDVYWCGKCEQIIPSTQNKHTTTV